ncbi:hypothetical protein B0H13DRAFT_2679456 [Mycena leptocephala]|nr:hypothetical protein B0H13DRAFT_2679456 [Mycena leptocephala]
MDNRQRDYRQNHPLVSCSNASAPPEMGTAEVSLHPHPRAPTPFAPESTKLDGAGESTEGRRHLDKRRSPAEVVCTIKLDAAYTIQLEGTLCSQGARLRLTERSIRTASLEARLRPTTEHRPDADSSSSAMLARPSQLARGAKERRGHTNSSTPTTIPTPTASPTSATRTTDSSDSSATRTTDSHTPSPRLAHKTGALPKNGERKRARGLRPQPPTSHRTSSSPPPRRQRPALPPPPPSPTPAFSRGWYNTDPKNFSGVLDKYPA